MITLGSLAPGKYRLEVAVTDNLAKQTITPTDGFYRQGQCRASRRSRGGEAIGSSNDSSLGLAIFGAACAPCRLHAAPNAGRISGVVVDPAGTPQMGATVLVSSEQLLIPHAPIRAADQRARALFHRLCCPSGRIRFTVTLAGFLPAIEQHIQVDQQHAALLQVVLGSVFSSFDKLRRQPDQHASATDDWTWVLAHFGFDPARASLAGRFRMWHMRRPRRPEAAPNKRDARIGLTSGADHPGSDLGLRPILPARHLSTNGCWSEGPGC